ncbi:tRNA(Met) cytidine acetyltransferase TmcA [Billgrantia gudaonensis]|uniref:tRNA(Met) cytidine acetyltransferase TmcA n=1 Tax=Billgrantia gudaonensis TaxID=376427 RepID=A0A1G8Z399_9GAMM|nr:GNAT family N-acetyltransferase [Halomonas gudaonensis]SDK09447.1 tRNA(Met) cytidine acetyltransferase [Halomonas gudaonensis]
MSGDEVLNDWSCWLRTQRWRGLVWVTGTATTRRDRGLSVWRGGDWRSPCWVAATRPHGVEEAHWLPADKAFTRLGSEHDLLVFDTGRDGDAFDPDAFGALTGTLRAGALALLLTPEGWGQAAGSRYVARLERRLMAAYEAARWLEAFTVPRLPTLAPLLSVDVPVDDAACLTDDQAIAVAHLVRLKRRRPLVLTADRGRGKTAALGIACARLLERGLARVHVTAPRPAAVAALFERLAALRPAGRRAGNAFVDAGGGRVEFHAPDELSDQVARGTIGGAGSLLLVDEAAAIPAGLLGQWLSAFPRIAFATTVHGYEGSGRGFALRFRERLARRTPQWREFHLSSPVRWGENDPLERLVSDLLLLDAEPASATPSTLAVDPHRESRSALIGDEPRLRAVFGLLVQAHYRTAPGDLRRLLDAPALHLTTLDAGKAPQAVAVYADEGGFDVALTERVARGERRPPGHLLAQSLAAHAGSRAALMARVRRVQRIAVHPDRRREGLGRRLLEAELAEARRDGIDLLGASFGAEPGLMAFWQALGFRSVRLGLSRETATGEHALMVVAPASPHGERLATELAARFQRLLPSLLAFELRELEPPLVVRLLAEGDGPGLNDTDRQDCLDVAFGHREPATARPALQALLQGYLAQRGASDDVEILALGGWAFQGRDWGWLAALLGVEGRRSAMAALRRATGHCLAAVDPPSPGAAGPVR